MSQALPMNETRGRLRTALRDNGLSILLAVATLMTLGGMLVAGWLSHNQQLTEDGRAAMSLVAYLVSADFQSAVFENWESEFLQMSTYVVATAFLFQRGSAESDDPDNPDVDPSPKPKSLAGWLHQYSLGLALAVLFVLSFVLHWLNSASAASAEAVAHGLPPITPLAYLGDAQLWFESLQNWQSEFMSTGVLVVLSIFLRFRGSPESKHVDAANAETGR